MIYQIESLDLIFVVVDGDRKLVGDIVSAAQSTKNPDTLRAALKAFLATAAQITDRDTEIARLRQKQAPAIVEIAQKLQDAGLNNWGNRASTAAAEISEECGDAVMAAIFEIRDIALEPPSWSQCDRIKLKFGWVCETTKTVLTPEQAIALQAILDVGPVATGPVAAEYLRFI